jgi:hypothetical protein
VAITVWAVHVHRPAVSRRGRIGDYKRSGIHRCSASLNAFSIWNPETLTSRRVFRSTKTSDKKQALEICRVWHKAALKARSGKLSVDAAREVIAQGVSDVFTAANVESLPSASIKSWSETWVEAKAIETEESTHARYKRVVERRFQRAVTLRETKSRTLSTLRALWTRRA